MNNLLITIIVILFIYTKFLEIAIFLMYKKEMKIANEKIDNLEGGVIALDNRLADIESIVKTKDLKKNDVAVGFKN